MIKRKTWEEFKNCGLLWWINMILHTFGWAIVIEFEDDKVTNAYPARTKFRGFSEKENDKGYIAVSKYLSENAKELEKEVNE